MKSDDKKDKLSESNKSIRENSGNANNFFLTSIKWLTSLKKHGKKVV